MPGLLLPCLAGWPPAFETSVCHCFGFEWPDFVIDWRVITSVPTQDQTLIAVVK